MKARLPILMGVMILLSYESKASDDDDLPDSQPEWPITLEKPMNFQMTTARFPYDPETGHLNHTQKSNDVKIRYYDSEHNRYLIHFYKDNIDYYITYDYKNHRRIESLSNGTCKNTRYDIDFNLKEYFKYFYDPEAGKLQYLGEILCPFTYDKQEMFYGFLERLETEHKKENIYYFGKGNGRLRWIEHRQSVDPYVTQVLGMKIQKFYDRDFDLTC